MPRRSWTRGWAGSRARTCSGASRRSGRAKLAAARKARNRIAAFFRWCIARNYRRDNPVDRAVEALPKVGGNGPKHYRALPHPEVPTALRAIRRTTDAHPASALCVELIALTAVRPGEARGRDNVRFTYGGSLEQPKVERVVPSETLRRDPKWTRYPMNEKFDVPDTPVLSDFFRIKRGLATGYNSYFILTAEEVDRRELPYQAFRPILPSPRYLTEDEVEADSAGKPCAGSPSLSARLLPYGRTGPKQVSAACGGI